MTGTNFSTRENRQKEYPSLRGRLMSCDHRHLGVDYLVFALFCGVIGTVLSLVMRLEAGLPMMKAFQSVAAYLFGAANVEEPFRLYALFSTAHALTMVFFMVLPALVGGFANLVVPPQVGCRQIAFARINRIAFWLLPVAFLLLLTALFLSLSGFVFPLLFLAVAYLAGLSFLVTFVSLITTIIAGRDIDMPLSALPIFAWSVLISSFLGVLSVPMILAALTFGLLTDMSSFASHLGDGKAQMMLWFFSHPQIYVLLLPAFGIVSQVIVTFSKRALVAEKIVISAMIFMGMVGFVLWCDSLFAPDNGREFTHYFAVALPLMGVPVAAIVMCWVATILSARPVMQVPVLWALGFVLVVLSGTLSATRFVAADPIYIQAHLPALITHFHYIVSLSAVFAIFCGWQYWFPAMSGVLVSNRLAVVQFWLLFLGIHLIFLPQYFAFSSVALISVVGAVAATLSVALFLYIIVEALLVKRPALQNPWGEGAESGEWQPFYGELEKVRLHVKS